MAGKKILIVEDEGIVAMHIENSLASLGYNISGTASSGKEAIEMIEKYRPDLVLMDIVIKGEMDGIEVAEHIRKHFGTPVIYLTAFGDDSTLQRARVTEPFGYILKPFKERELHIAIEIALYKHEAEEAIHKAEKKYSDIVEKGNDGIVIIQDGLVKFVNKRMTEFTGFTVEEVIGKRFIDFISPAYRETTIEKYKKRMAGMDVPNIYELEIISKDSKIIPVEVNASLIELDSGPADMAIVRDITERKKAEEKIIKFSKELMALAEFAYVLGIYTRKESMENVYDAICNSCMDFGVDMAWVGVYDSNDTSNGTALPIACAGIEDRDMETINFIWECTDGLKLKNDPYVINDVLGEIDPESKEAAKLNYRSKMWMPLILHTGEQIGMLVLYSRKPGFFTQDKMNIFRILTMHAAFVIKNRQLIEDLENQIRKRTADLIVSQDALLNLVEDMDIMTTDLKETNIKLKELDRMKSMFIASTSHELRTPLNSIIGFSSILLEGWSGELTGEQREQVNNIHDAGRQLLSLINDIIDITKVEAGKASVHISDFRLREVVDQAVGMVRTKLDEKDLAMVVDVPDIIMTTDKQRLLQCLLNYLSNAVKFTEKGSVTLTARRINGDIEILVSDTGIGISEENITKLFMPFVRLESSISVQAGGTGLGLYLTKKLVQEVLGGTVCVTSKPGMGSTFAMRVPVKLEERT